LLSPDLQIQDDGFGEMAFGLMVRVMVRAALLKKD